MRPDRIIVGEVRGPEAWDMVSAGLHTGHDGALCTGHANSSKDMLSRLETMIWLNKGDFPVEAIRRQIASGIDILIHLGRMRDKSRKVLDVSEVCGVKEGQIQLHTIYCFRELEERDGTIYGAWEKRGELQKLEKIKTLGLEKEYRELVKRETSGGVYTSGDE